MIEYPLAPTWVWSKLGRNLLGTWNLFADALLLFEPDVDDRVVETVRCDGLDDAKLPPLLPKAELAKLPRAVFAFCPPARRPNCLCARSVLKDDNSNH